MKMERHRSAFGATLCGVALLAACTSEVPAPTLTNATVVPEATIAAEPLQAPVYLAINIRTHGGPLPTGQTRGALSLEGKCIVFGVRDQLFTPIWPVGTAYKMSDDHGVIRTPGGQAYQVPSESTLGGGSFAAVESPSLKLALPLPKNCPQATYVVQE